MTRKTNVEFLTDYMEFGSPLRQAFVIDSLAKAAEQVMAQGVVEPKGWPNLISWTAWRDCAADFLLALEARK